jgi:serine/threonine protein kinase
MNNGRSRIFGITSEGASARELTTSAARGTDGYRAPELLRKRGGVFNNKVDIWAFGCVLFEVVVSRQLFSSDYSTLQYRDAGLREQSVPDPLSELSMGDMMVFCDAILGMVRLDYELRPNANIILSWLKEMMEYDGNRTPRELDLVPGTGALSWGGG